jgi:transcriptional regulator with XRE-family HTH domain
VFGENLRRLRKRADLSQEELGHACEPPLHRTEVGLLERSERDARLSTMVRLARALDVPIAELLEGIG